MKDSGVKDPGRKANLPEKPRGPFLMAASHPPQMPQALPSVLEHDLPLLVFPKCLQDWLCRFPLEVFSQNPPVTAGMGLAYPLSDIGVAEGAPVKPVPISG